MNTKIKNLLSAVLGTPLTKNEAARKSDNASAPSKSEAERSQLIDQLVASWGNDLQARHRYFGL